MSPIFIDFEASGLGEDSWPVEIGVAWLEGDAIRVRTSLIRPHSDWPSSAWSPQSARIHAIARDALDAAPTAEAVAREYAALLTGAIVLSDAPDYDGRWWRRLATLLDPAPDVRIGDFEAAAFAEFRRQPHALDWVFETRERTPAPHRAGRAAPRKSMARGRAQIVVKRTIRSGAAKRRRRSRRSRWRP